FLGAELEADLAMESRAGGRGVVFAGTTRLSALACVAGDESLGCTQHIDAALDRTDLRTRYGARDELDEGRRCGGSCTLQSPVCLDRGGAPRCQDDARAVRRADGPHEADGPRHAARVVARGL